MVAQVRTALQALTGAQKAIAALTGLGVTGVGLIVGLSGYISLPARAEDLERRVTSLEESRRFGTCWMLEAGASRDPNVCRYLLKDPDEFRPPYTPVVP